MPKYVERDKVRPIPGAFGLERSKEEWERRYRPMGSFYDGTGKYRHALRILIDEEYGYREWLWTYFGTVEELVADWKAGRRPVSFWGAAKGGGWKGELDQVHWSAREDGVSRLYLVETGEIIGCITRYWVHEPGGPDGTAHVHEQDDSSLRIRYYELHGLDPVTEKIHVLDAMAAI